MRANFKCKDCNFQFSQDLFQGNKSFHDNWGLYVHNCPSCRGSYMDCENLHECLEALEAEVPHPNHINKEKRI